MAPKSSCLEGTGQEAECRAMTCAECDNNPCDCVECIECGEMAAYLLGDIGLCEDCHVKHDDCEHCHRAPCGCDDIYEQGRDRAMDRSFGQ